MKVSELIAALQLADPEFEVEVDLGPRGLSSITGVHALLDDSTVVIKGA